MTDFGFYEVTDSTLYTDGTKEIVFLCSECAKSQGSRFKSDSVWNSEENWNLSDHCDICNVSVSQRDWEEHVLDLIDRSIKRWREIVFTGSCDDECPLCSLFCFSDCSNGNDVLCPIAEMTDVAGCWGTPFYKYREFLLDDPKVPIYANQMLSFLYSVRLFWVNKMNRR